MVTGSGPCYRGCALTVMVVLSLLLAPSAVMARSAPDFELPRLRGEGVVSLQEYRGSIVIVDFWASWCQPCRTSMPAYNTLRNKLQKEFGPDAFEVLAINLDLEPDQARQFLEAFQLDYPVLRESGYQTQRRYGLTAMPTAFLVDQRGRIRDVWQGYAAHYLPQLRKRLEKLIRERQDQPRGGARERGSQAAPP